MNKEIDRDFLELKAKLLGSLLEFTQVFYKLRTGRDFIVDHPEGRESHQITICRALTDAFYGRTSRLLINIAPGLGKSELMKHFVAWSLAHYPDAKFIYISYSHDLAAEHTSGIKEIISLPAYRKLFNVQISQDSSAKDHFKTSAGGAVYAAGSGGAITGFDAGLPIMERFNGACIMDDMHKPTEVHSDVTRETVKNNFINTILLRQRSPRTPFIFIGQRLHEDDLPAAFMNEFDGYKWTKVILPSLDNHDNALCPRVHPLEKLLISRDKTPYVFAAQHQQDPQPAGGGLFKADDFPLISTPNNIVAMFMTMDTAETTNTLNDATALSLWGVHKIVQMGIESNLWGLHWLDCMQVWVEPRDLESYFMDFYARNSRRLNVPISFACIEKKSTGTTLYSILKGMQGIKIIPIERNAGSGSKADRFISVQSYASSRYVSLPKSGAHTQMCIEHMKKITANDTHARDDIADTYVDAVTAVYRDKIILPHIVTDTQIEQDKIAQELHSSYDNMNRAMAGRWG